MKTTRRSEPARVWILGALLAGPDGSIHVLSAAGKLLDRFNYGVPLQGLATATYQNQLILLVSSSKGLEAWKVE